MAEGIPTRQLKKDAAGIAFLILALFLLMALLGRDPADRPSDAVYPQNATAKNWCGPLGAYASWWLVEWFGFAASVVVLAANGFAMSCFQQSSAGRLARRAFGYLLLTFTLAVFSYRLALVFAEHPDLWPGSWIGLNQGKPDEWRIQTRWLQPAAGAGGICGFMISGWMDGGLSRLGSTVVLLPLAIFGFLQTNDPLVGGIGRLMGLVGALFVNAAVGAAALPARLRRRSQETMVASRPNVRLHIEPEAGADETPAAEDGFEDGVEGEDVNESTLQEDSEDDAVQEIRIVRTGMDFEPAPEPIVNLSAIRPEFAQPQLPSNVRLPDLEILDDIPPFDFGNVEQEVRERARLVEKTFAEFQMAVQVVQIDTGPVVTQYEIKLEPGLRASKVIALADDLAIALRAASVRIVAPIPGKNTVGIEVPNEHRAKVTIKEVITKAPASAGAMRLPLYLGKDVKGQPLVCDLANMPHLLIAGRTGTGKSVCLNALILSILMSRTPDQVKMLMIDPKMVELSLYKDIPHLLHPVVTDMKKAEALLGWAVDKMEERYDLLARAGVRHIDSYNKLSREEIVDRLGEEDARNAPDRLPYILIFADEMADLMMTAAKEVEAHIIRLAQKARAVGIHLVLATQKPTVDVITGLIKSNLPARIAFQVASRVDSAVVLDEKGADKLLGNGDMLFLYPGTSKIIRAQGTFVSDDEVTRVVEHLCSQAKPQYSQELMQLQSSVKTGSEIKSLAERDEMYEAAIDVVVREQRGSVSLLQRALGVGYGRGARLIDYMAEDGIVGGYNGSQARDVLYTMEEWEEVKRTRWGKAG